MAKLKPVQVRTDIVRESPDALATYLQGYETITDAEIETLQQAMHDMHRSPEDVAAYMKLQIATDIYAAMEKQGIDQSELARRLGKSRQYVSRVLNERTNFTLDSLARIACALNMRVAVRFFEHDEHLDILPDAKPKKSPVDFDTHNEKKKAKSNPRAKGSRKAGGGKG